ncbi:MAG TPA: DUF1801 domain-containing protein [Cytophagales bacterium]|nr:DUF1801 domain-containing protein [Cytophagales bacterium]
MATKKQNPEQGSVTGFLDALEHPMKAEILQVRDLILKAGVPLTETIKWNAPNFCHEGADRITFNLQGRGFFRLIFHCGAKVRETPLETRLFEDSTGLLDWASNDRAIMRFKDADEVRSQAQALQQVVVRWIEHTC